MFVTLTYDENNVPIQITDGDYIRQKDANQNQYMYGTKTLVKKDLQDYIKRVRKTDPKKTGMLKYYAIGEYGGKTLRPHYHVLVWNYSQKQEDALIQKWTYGHVDVGNVEDASIHYVTGYLVTANEQFTHRQKEFAVMSKGIGKAYIQRNAKIHANPDYPEVNEFTVSNNGYRQTMPRYYRDMIFSDKRKKLHVEKVQEKLAQDEQKFIKECHEKGLDPWKYKVQMIEYQRELLKKRRKKAKKL